MPRVIFQLFWEFIQSNRPIVAYVKNLAKDKRYYWVVALAVPIPNGYLSGPFQAHIAAVCPGKAALWRVAVG